MYRKVIEDLRILLEKYNNKNYDNSLYLFKLLPEI